MNLRRSGPKLRLMPQSDNFISEIVKESAKATLRATAIATSGLSIYYILYLLAERLMSVADAIQGWLDLLGSLR
jgi:hypothetical protein